MARKRIRSKIMQEVKVAPKRVRKRNNRHRYVPTIKECQMWFDVINREVFGNSLERFRRIEIRRRHGCWAETESTLNPDGERFCTLSLNHHFKSKKHFLDVMTHEMVHHYEWTILQREMTHGYQFYKWKPKLKRFGLSLTYAS